MNKEYIVSPSLLATDPMNMGRDIKMLESAGAKWFHVDCMDGSFVPNFSFGYSIVSAINKLSNVTLDVHLMIDKPIRYIDEYSKAGADYLTIHVEADTEENYGKRMNVNEYQSSIEEFANHNEGATLADYLNSITLSSDTDEIDEGNFVSVATIHSVKGL